MTWVTLVHEVSDTPPMEATGRIKFECQERECGEHSEWMSRTEVIEHARQHILAHRAEQQESP